MIIKFGSINIVWHRLAIINFISIIHLWTISFSCGFVSGSVRPIKPSLIIITTIIILLLLLLFSTPWPLNDGVRTSIWFWPSIAFSPILLHTLTALIYLNSFLFFVLLTFLINLVRSLLCNLTYILACFSTIQIFILFFRNNFSSFFLILLLWYIALFFWI